MKSLQAVRGMKDLLPETAARWQWLEQILKQFAESYGYSEIRLPVMERTELFLRSIGEVTDIVEKEMYTFTDRSEERMTLRPEATAGCVRAGIEHGLFYHQQQRWWYLGPMFRYERPQKGRYRQFYHFGLEAYGFAGPEVEAELMALAFRLWNTLGIADKVELHLNSLGTSASRQRYRDALVAYFQTHHDVLDEDSQRRLTTNPLRILDSKNPAMQVMIEQAPSILESLEPESLARFEKLQEYLHAMHIPFKVNTRLVRGLDYYSHTVFEFITTHLGAQGTLCGGGRYDQLISDLGGPETPAFGMAMGIDRVMDLLSDLQQLPETPVPDVMLLTTSRELLTAALTLAEEIRQAAPHCRVLVESTAQGLKNQFKRADKSGCRYALILADQEYAQQQVILKSLRAQNETQQIFSKQDFIKQCANLLGKEITGGNITN